MILKGRTKDRLKGLSLAAIPDFEVCNDVYSCFAKLLMQGGVVCRQYVACINK